MTPIFIVNAFGLMLLAILIALILNGVERKVVARMQSRIGPPILQPIIDIKKLLMKENIVPETAVKWVFNTMPFVAISTALVFFLYVPFAGQNALLKNQGDLILVLYLLVIPPLALAIGGFASGSNFASIGAQRELVLMLSYEFVLATIVFSLSWLYSVTTPNMPVFSVDLEARPSPWLIVGPFGTVGILLLLITSLAVMPAKAGKLPHDMSEAKTEIADGALAEYSGLNLALLYITQALRTFGFATFIVFLFFPCNIEQFFGFDPFFLPIFNFFFFLAKVFAVMFCSVFIVSAVTARFRIDQASAFYIFTIFTISLFGLLLLILDFFIGGQLYALFG
ncbi:MAG: NADH-quinone oxidoreductase subunit H [Candidatus Diapherotrites archaeon]|nr:NADH-quinone oxidoreductase subunit H [Candidatus Diapherotrites archaeon]